MSHNAILLSVIVIFAVLLIVSIMVIGMVRRRFEKRFARIDEQFTALNKFLDELFYNKFDNLRGMFDERIQNVLNLIEKSVKSGDESMKKEMGSLSKKIQEAHSGIVDTIYATHGDIKKILEGFEFKTTLNELSDGIQDKLGVLGKRLDTMEKGIHGFTKLNEQFHQALFDELAQRDEKVVSQVSESVKSQKNMLKGKVDEIEQKNKELDGRFELIQEKADEIAGRLFEVKYELFLDYCMVLAKKANEEKLINRESLKKFQDILHSVRTENFQGKDGKK